MTEDSVVYGLLANTNSVLFTKLPKAVYSTFHGLEQSTPIHNDSRAAPCDQIFDFLKYYQIANHCTSAQVSESRVLNCNIVHRPARETPNSRRLRTAIMSPKVSLASFERAFLYDLMVQNFESPFEEDVTASDHEDVQIELSNPGHITKSKLSQLLLETPPLHCPSPVSSSKPDYISKTKEFLRSVGRI